MKWMRANQSARTFRLLAELDDFGSGYLEDDNLINSEEGDAIFSTSGQSREAVGAPAFAAHSVMHEEEAVRIVLVFYSE